LSVFKTTYEACPPADGEMSLYPFYFLALQR